MLRRPRTILCAALLAVGVATGQQPAWLLVRSEAKSLGTFSWERLAKTYLRSNYRIVAADEADTHPPSNRLVVGTPDDNPLVADLARQLGITFEGEGFRYGGSAYPADAGLALVTDDPDGGGTLALFMGASPEGAFHCLSVPVDLSQPGYVVMTYQKALHRAVVPAQPLRVAGDVLRVVRLDRDLWRIRDEMAGSSPDEAALRVSRALAGYLFLFQRAVRQNVNLLSFTRSQLRDLTELDTVRGRFAGVDLAAVLDSIESRVAKALGGRRGPRPVVYTIVAEAGGTNAQMIGPDPDTGRNRVMLNLAAFATLRDLHIAAAHEFVHTLQSAHDGTLLGRAVHEGVATYVSQRVLPQTKDHEALMWTPAKLAAAAARREPIMKAFRARKDSQDMRQLGSFLYAGTPLHEVPDAPDRCGYYVGWLAASAWHAANQGRPLGDLLRVPPAELLAALPE